MTLHFEHMFQKMSKPLLRPKGIPQYDEILTIGVKFEHLHNQIIVVQLSSLMMQKGLQFEWPCAQQTVEFDMDLLRIEIVGVILAVAFFGENEKKVC